MAMNEIMGLSLALFAGLSLGALFFGGLWWTVRRSLSAAHPSIWLFASLMLRMSATLVGFYLVGRGDWQRLAVSLVGFVLARAVVMRLTPWRESAVTTEAVHAPES
jgi:F1F0 ATPase subunit 2